MDCLLCFCRFLECIVVKLVFCAFCCFDIIACAFFGYFKWNVPNRFGLIEIDLSDNDDLERWAAEYRWKHTQTFKIKIYTVSLMANHFFFSFYFIICCLRCRIARFRMSDFAAYVFKNTCECECSVSVVSNSIFFERPVSPVRLKNANRSAFLKSQWVQSAFKLF